MGNQMLLSPARAHDSNILFGSCLSLVNRRDPRAPTRHEHIPVVGRCRRKKRNNEQEVHHAKRCPSTSGPTRIGR